MSTAAALDRIGVGIDTARYGHRVSFLRPDRRPAAKPLTDQVQQLEAITLSRDVLTIVIPFPDCSAVDSG